MFPNPIFHSLFQWTQPEQTPSSLNRDVSHFLSIPLVTLGLLLGLALSFHAAAQTIQFKYDLKITADPAKRAAYLKQSGGARALYRLII